MAILDLRIQSDALLLKYLHKFYNHWDLPWVDLIWSTYYTDKIPHASDPCGSFWWKDLLKLTPIYRVISHVIVRRGDTALMWKDLWLDDVLAYSHPVRFLMLNLKIFRSGTSLAAPTSAKPSTSPFPCKLTMNCEISRRSHYMLAMMQKRA